MTACGYFDWAMVVEPLTTVGAVLLAFFLGRWTYLWQKEHELVRIRYLEGGVDRFAGNIDYALGAIRYNLARTLHILKLYRDVDVDEAAALAARSSFRSIEADRMDLEAGYRLQMLTRNPAYGRAQGLLFAFADAAEYFFVNDVGALVRLVAAGKVSVEDQPKVLERAVEEAKSYEERAARFYTLFYRLQELGRLLERRNISFRKLDEFAEDSEVRRISAKIEELFPPEEEISDGEADI
jgi:hypothetical protein